jgi:hypothetical protein
MGTEKLLFDETVKNDLTLITLDAAEAMDLPGGQP